MKWILKLLILTLIVTGCSKSTSYVNNPGAPEYLHNRPVGASANELLSGSTYSSLKIEILYMPGYVPDAAAINHAQSTLAALLNKSTGINISTKEIPASSIANMSVNDVIDVEKNNRTAFTSSKEIAVCIIYTNGNYTDASTLGLAYRNTSAVLFGKKIQENSGGFGQVSRTKLEATVLEHEIGHLLGLVDLGSPMQSQHKDNAHGSHCSNSSCLMYYTSETTDILGFLLTGAIPAFDANCRADLVANGGK